MFQRHRPRHSLYPSHHTSFLSYASARDIPALTHTSRLFAPSSPPLPSFQAAWARSPTRLAKPPAATDAPIRRLVLPAPPALPTLVRKIRENEWRSADYHCRPLPWLREMCYDHAPRLAVAGRLQRTPRRFIGGKDRSAGSIHLLTSQDRLPDSPLVCLDPGYLPATAAPAASHRPP